MHWWSKVYLSSSAIDAYTLVFSINSSIIQKSLVKQIAKPYSVPLLKGEQS
jgi:hypothetical protein